MPASPGQKSIIRQITTMFLLIMWRSVRPILKKFSLPEATATAILMADCGFLPMKVALLQNPFRELLLTRLHSDPETAMILSLVPESDLAFTTKTFSGLQTAD